MDEWSFAGLLNARYLYTEFHVPRRCRAVADIRRTSAFRLNGEWFPGAPYRQPPHRVPVILTAGVNRVLVKVSGYGGELRGTFLLSPAAGPLWMDATDTVRPDMIRGRDLEGPVGIPVWNTTDRWIGPVRIEVQAPGGGHAGRRSIAGVAPLAVRKPSIPIRLKWEAVQRLLPAGAREGTEVPLVVSLYNGSGRTLSDPETIRIAVRPPGAPQRVTFVSRLDRSPQYYGVRPPGPSPAGGGLALILTLHGASVEAYKQARAYGSKSWAYIVAPTNRRPYGFDWHDWGRLDALEVLDLALDSYPVDSNRVCLTGHSMGGHGTWAVGVHHVSRFAAAGPSAGWSHFDLYVPMLLRRGRLAGDPVYENLWRRMRAGELVPLHLDNLRRIPVFVLHGGDDDNVPPTHGRFLARELARRGGRVTYVEVPGKGHWWDDDRERPGAACVDYPAMMELFRDARREPWPTEVEFTLSDVTIDGGRRAWVEVLEQTEPLRPTWVRARIRGWGVVEVESRNAAALALYPSHWSRGDWRVTIAGRTHRAGPQMPLVLHKDRDGGHWSVARHGSRTYRRLLTRGEYGRQHGLKAGFLRPFLLVYGASGTPPETAAALQVARNLARNWAYRGNGDAPIVSDRDLLRRAGLPADTPPRSKAARLRVAAALAAFEKADHEPYHIVFIGNEESHALLAAWSIEPVAVRRAGVFLSERLDLRSPEPDRHRFAGSRSVAALVRDPLNPDRVTCLWGGTDPASLRRGSSVHPFFAGAGWPDVLVFDEAFQVDGWGGASAAGIIPPRDR
ncbi:MAG: prolyl oligopeptidase family serine peptidase [Candidatus Eisenbacteria bacterium]|nr:prolyl oligopeptidase family serine peptidase [Candidatus Eisenbacteria bacterium]